ncbi:hypothetical protein [Marinovum sp.]|uniref:hypothetical protein n=1 Tax=Marinovum sp. TaxID=2024839 RepID=UPI002B27605F|nr:hypothetical protein [Marinovum sp.]
MYSLINWVIETLNATALSGFIMGSAWVFPMLEMLHFFGLCLLFGSLLIVDLRVIGLAPRVPVSQVEVFVRITLVGFAINLITGTLFLIGDSDRYLVNIAFWLKMGVIALAALNTAWFVRRIRPQIQAGFEGSELSADARFIAGASLVFWTAVIVLGRMIPYVEE